MTDETFGPFAESIRIQKYAHTKADGTKENWAETARRVATNVFAAVPAPRSLVEETERLIRERKFMPGGRYLAAAGRRTAQTQNCLLLRAEDSRWGWGELMEKVTLSLMTGAGIGVVYSDLRPKGALVRGSGGTSTGPVALMQMVNEAGRGIMQGGDRRSAIWAGLHWNHPDIKDFIHLKDWSPEVVELKAKDFNFPAKMDHTNISVILDDAFFTAYNNPYNLKHEWAYEVYWTVVGQMMQTGEPGFSVDIGSNENENLRNACTEITSRDDSDICNLGSLNLARFDSLHEFEDAVEVATAFLLAGTVYSSVPYPRVDQVRTKNRRLGLGVMGVHEFLLKRGYKYGFNPELEQYLHRYEKSGRFADEWADNWGLSRPVKTRAIAPTGTIGIVAETTTGIEPLFCAAYKRRWITNGDQHAYQYVVDPTARKLVDGGVDPRSIEDAYSLAADVERRVKLQSMVQAYVDHGISSTINLPAWGSELNNELRVKEFGEMLYKYLPSVRGITTYPDGARGGQPLSPVSYEEAVRDEGQTFYEQVDVCSISGKGGSCGS